MTTSTTGTTSAERNARLRLFERHREELLGCTRCPRMIGPVIAAPAVITDIVLLGQAPGPHEGKVGRPFGWTAGKTLFGWLDQIGIDESTFRSRVFMAAVCRCFPGKSSGGGDRVPSRAEIDSCRPWLARELELIRPKLLIPVGRLAIHQVLPATKLVDVIGLQHQVSLEGRRLDAIPLPHPSGASTWHRTEPGVSLLRQALELLAKHPSMSVLAEP